MELTPQGLQALYSLPVEASQNAYDLGQQLSQSNNINNAQLQETLSNDQLSNPIRRQHLQGMVDTQQANLPGLQAASDMTVRKNQNQALLNDAQVADLTSKYSSDQLQRHVSDLDNLGNLSLQLAETTWANPLGAAARAKQAFAQAGHGDMWNPQWDNLPPDQLAMQLNQMGSGIRANNAKLQQAVATAKARGDSMLGLEALRQQGRQSLEANKAKWREELKNTASAALKAKDPTTLQALAVKRFQQAQETDDPTDKAELMGQANAAFQGAYQLNIARTQAGQAGKVDVGANTGLATVPPPPLPTLDGTQPTAGTQVPAPPQQAQPADIQGALKQSGIPYEPDKFDYRINPQTGKVQRKPKGQ